MSGRRGGRPTIVEEERVATIEELQRRLRRMREEMQAMRAQVALTPTLLASREEPKSARSRRSLHGV
jgi:hypothetical protein